jgi:predicted metal-dependent peptidase
MEKIKSLGWKSLMAMVLVLALGFGTESCKSTGKMSKKERKAQIEIAKKQLQSIIDGTSTLSLSEQERQVNDIINKKLNDPTVNDLIIQAQQAIKKAYAEREKLHQQKVDAARAQLLDMLMNKDGKSAEALQQELNTIKSQNLGDAEINDLISKVQGKIDGMKNKPALPIKTQLENAFQGIADAAKAGNITEADNLIKNTLQYFSDPDAPVLIIIYRQGSTVDYDKPTTIQRYLNFCKDQKKSMNAIDAIQQDASGKIKSLDLIKK